jgi:hypothetical protein
MKFESRKPKAELGPKAEARAPGHRPECELRILALPGASGPGSRI